MIDCYENCKDIRNEVCPPMKMFCPKKLAEHDSKLIDKVGEYLFNSRYASEKIADFDYDQTVTFSKLEWLQIIAEIKAEVSE